LFLVSHFKSSFLSGNNKKNQRHPERQVEVERERERKDWKEEMDTTIRLGHQRIHMNIQGREDEYTNPTFFSRPRVCPRY